MAFWFLRIPQNESSGKSLTRYLEKTFLSYEDRQPTEEDIVFVGVDGTKPGIVALWQISRLKFDRRSGTGTVEFNTGPRFRPILFEELRQLSPLRKSRFIRGRSFSNLQRLTRKEAACITGLIHAHNPRLTIPGRFNEVEEPVTDVDVESPFEGSRVWKRHLKIERTPSVIKEKKKRVLFESKRLLCEVCGFDFQEFYRLPPGVTFCEGHHKKPLSALKRSMQTKPDDIGLVCSNCHRAIHLIKPMPTLADFKRKFLRRGL